MSGINFPRSALMWLILAISSVYLPLQMHLPLWISLVFISVIIWRWMMHLGHWPFPNSAVKVVVVVLAITAVVVSAKGRFHLESATTFILVASLLKVLEIKDQRDGVIIIFITMFLLAVNFLFEQGFFTALYSLLAVWLLLSALVGLHQTASSEQPLSQNVWRAGKTSSQVLLLSLPTMLVLFLLFPRLEPLWTLNLQSNKAKTGLSDQMSPGDIADLSNSDELVFRVQFEGPLPTADQWYWRGLVLDYYEEVNGKSRWSMSDYLDPIDWYPKSWRPEDNSEGVVDYRIIQEGSDKKWLFGLRGVAAMEMGIGMTHDDRIVSQKKLLQRKEYAVRSKLGMKIAAQGLKSYVRQKNVQLPSLSSNGQGNPKTRVLAQQIFSQYDTDTERMQKALQYYPHNNFSYTLKPGLMLENDIDKFLFEKRAGFCAHFSSSFVFLMRAMNIPARVVAGYQGGELNPESGHITVRQYDAHAWVEVWLEDQGWVSVDPTAQVAPERINQGLREALTGKDEFLSGNNFSLLKLSHFPWLNDVRLQLDQLNYYWHKTVLNFNKNKQGSLLKEWFGNGFLKKSLYALAGLFCVFFLLITLIVLWRKPNAKESVLVKTLRQFDKRISESSASRRENEGLSDYSLRLQQQYPKQSESIHRLFEKLQSHYFSKVNPDNKENERLLAKNLIKLARQLSKEKKITEK
ncbi:MAG: transglutaminase-like putative cysteine protease [Oleispira sp.]|jgi:transglutaminase-like putative cysteine protease